MSDNADLIAEFGGGKTADNMVVSPNADLINHFGGDTIKAIPAPAPTVAPSPYPNPANYTGKGNENYTPPNQFVEDIKNAPGYIKRKTIENYEASKAYAGKGIKDISQNLPASGVPEVVLGAMGMATAVPNAVIQGTDKLFQKATGNKDFRPAELATTTGLPILKGGSIIANAMPSTRALTEIVNIVGKENLPKVIEELQSNPRLTLMDVNPNARITAMGLAAQPGKPLDVLNKFVENRKTDQKATVLQAYDEAMGMPVSIKDKVDKLKENIKETGKEINPVVSNAKPVDISPVVSDIDNILKPGVQSVISAGQPLPGPRVKEELADFRKLLTDDKSVRTDAKELHSIQSALRAKAEDLLNSQSGQDRQIGYSLMKVRNQIVEAIDKASPQIIDAEGKSIGTYKPALAKYREVNDVDDAFKKGQLITRNKLGQLDDHPEYWERWIKDATPAEKEAAKEGARLAVAHQMGAFRFASRKGMEIPESEFNSDKLKLLFGEKETNKLMKTLSDERRINDTDTKLTQNSMTALRLLGAKATEVRPDYKPNLSAYLPAIAEGAAQYMTGGESMGMAAAGVIGYNYARKGAVKLGQNLDRKTNVEISKLASATGEEKDNLIKALSDYLPNNSKSKLLQKAKTLALPVLPP